MNNDSVTKYLSYPPDQNTTSTSLTPKPRFNTELVKLSHILFMNISLYVYTHCKILLYNVAIMLMCSTFGCKV